MSEGLPRCASSCCVRFVRTASTIPGVTRIALVGSLATMKANPKDAMSWSPSPMTLTLRGWQLLDEH
jgi:hypothetical protein